MTKLSATLEDYLQVIFRFQQEKQFARISEVASSLKVARSAVTAALHSPTRSCKYCVDEYLRGLEQETK